MNNKTLFICLLVIGILIIPPGCKKNQVAPPDPQGVLLDYNGCKNTAARQSARGISAAAKVQECVEYSYDGTGKLEMDHINAVFNCCPGEISVVFEFNGKTIIITEKQEKEGCYCICHFDVNMRLDNIQPGIYTIRLKAGDNHGTDREFSINLNSNQSGSKCWDSPL